MPKGRRLTEDVALKLLQAFRETPGRASVAAMEAGIDYRTAKKAWEFGLNATPGLERPISEIIHEEQNEARARLAALKAEQERKLSEEEQERKRKALEAARIDATESRVQEVQMIRLARAGAGQLLSTLTLLGKGAVKLGDKVRHTLEETANKDKLTMPESAAITRLISGMTNALRQATDAAQRAMEMERLLLGEPQSIVGVLNAETISTAEAEARIQAAAEALASAKARGIVLEGDRPLPVLPMPLGSGDGDPGTRH